MFVDSTFRPIARHVICQLFVLLPFCVARGDEPHRSLDVAELKLSGASLNIELAIAKKAFEVETPTGKLMGNRADESRVTEFLRRYAKEFALYPRALVARSELRRVVLCEGLTFNGYHWGKCTEFGERTIYVDVKFRLDDEHYMRVGIHHEFFHLIDFKINPVFKDERWSAINRPGFKYGKDGPVGSATFTALALTDKYPGFLNHYSTLDISEDRAEVFGNMIAGLARIEKLSKKDPILRAKVQRMKEILTEFCPQANADFWQRIRKLNPN